MVLLVKVDKLSVSFDPDLGDAVRAAAQRSGRGLSAWLAEAAAARLRSDALAEFLDAWEAEHGELTAESSPVLAPRWACPSRQEWGRPRERPGPRCRRLRGSGTR